jgi:putative ABC transport system permease protein
VSAGLHDRGRAVRLALADAAHEWRATACLVLALAAVLAPLLVLFGLRFGVVETLGTRLSKDPRTLEIVPIGAGRFDAAWFERARGWPGVAFVVPRTRAIAATIDLVKDGRPAPAELAPTATGDPLLATSIIPAHAGEVVLSAPLARKLGAKQGDAIAGWIGRTLEGRQERAKIDLTVWDVLDEDAYGRDAAFVMPAVLDQAEDYRDGFAAPLFSAAGRARPDGARTYAGFRLYARSIYDVAALRDRLLGERVEALTSATEIQTLIALDRNLGFLFWLIAALGGAGFLLSLGASLWGAVERKRKDLAIMGVLGFRAGALALFPTVQALLVALAGSGLALSLYFLISAIVNAQFATSLAVGEQASRLPPQAAVGAVVVVTVAALFASMLAGWRAARIDPAEGMRDV